MQNITAAIAIAGPIFSSNLFILVYKMSNYKKCVHDKQPRKQNPQPKKQAHCNYQQNPIHTFINY